MTDQNSDFRFIVGIAASAGGLEAMSKLASSLPTDLDCVYVLAQHMSPKHESMLVELLSRETRLNVLRIDEDVAPVPNSIYVPPAGIDVIVENGQIKLVDHIIKRGSPTPSADRLFKSIAATMGERSIGIVLSGTGRDGSYGIQAIREAGGIGIAQSPESSKYDAMPSSAIETGCIDLVLSPEEIGQWMRRILVEPRDLAQFRASPTDIIQRSDLFQILLSHTGVDFRNYKKNTMQRRISRRMLAKEIDGYEDYVDLCRKSPAEVTALFKDLLISVTRFFRDPASFLSLEDAVRAYITDNPRARYRIWVVGCATGEEAYSVAIVFCDVLRQMGLDATTQVQVLATDIDEHALSVARKGIYNASAALDIPDAYLDRYFTTSGGDLRVNHDIRKRVSFSRQNVFQDPPFAKIDLVCIRNTLIYFDTALQDRVFARMVFAMRSTGLVFLGTSETINEVKHPFRAVDTSNRIYQKQADRETQVFSQLAAPYPSRMAEQAGRRPTEVAQQTTQETWRKYDKLAKVVCPIGFMTNQKREILTVYGDISPFCEITRTFQNGLTVNFLKRALALEANSLIPLAGKAQQKRPGRWHKFASLPDHMCRLHCFPIEAEPKTGEEFVLVAIETQERSKSPALPNMDRDSTAYVAHLESELVQLREALQITVEELQTSNSILMATNEELRASAEQARLMNEELETTNEELQSTNEELITVNEELLVKGDDLEAINTELNGILETLPLPVITLDRSLMIRNASQKAQDDYKLTRHSGSFGHLSHYSLPAEFPQMLDLCTEVFASHQTETHIVRIGDTRYRLILSPFDQTNKEPYGLTVVLIPTDNPIDTRLIDILQDFSEMGSWHFDFLQDRMFWSKRTYQIHERPMTPEQITFEQGLSYYHPDDRERVSETVSNAVEAKKAFRFRARLITGSNKIIAVESAGAPLMNLQDEVIGIVGVFRDYSQHTTGELLTKHMLQIQEEEDFGFYSIDIEHNLPYWSPKLFRLLGLDPDQAPSVEAALNVFSAEDRERIAKHLQHCIETGTSYEYSVVLPKKDGTPQTFRGVGHADLDSNGKTRFVYGSFTRVCPSRD